MAQLVEHRSPKPRVGGSTPSGPVPRNTRRFNNFKGVNMSKFFLAVVVVALSACAPAAEKKEDVTPAVDTTKAAPADTTATAPSTKM